MGLTLQWSDFNQVLKTPKRVVLVVFLQFTVMPFLGWILAILFDLPPFFAVGLILVASCPGGTASKIIVYLAKANVALSVTMTTISTLAAIIMTPLLTSYGVILQYPKSSFIPGESRGYSKPVPSKGNQKT